MNRNILIITVGISGCGKSTWAKKFNKFNRFIIVSSDAIRIELTDDVNDQSKNNEVFKIANNRIVDALNNDKNVIFDATNLQSKYRKIFLEEIKSRTKFEFTPFAKIFEVDPEVTKLRIYEDVKNNINRADVPNYVIDKQYIRFCEDYDKIKSDGFNILYGSDEEITPIDDLEMYNLT